jgi:hypothetical protein
MTWRNGTVGLAQQGPRLLRLAIPLAVVGLLAASSVAEAKTAAASKLDFTVKISQGPTMRHPHPPAGDAGDVFSTTLTMFAVAPQFGKSANARLGTMTFSYTLHGSCSSAAAGCSGTTNITTLTRLPGGTRVADGNNVPFSKKGFVLPIQAGTGRFAGAKGLIAVAPAGQARSTYTINLP